MIPNPFGEGKIRAFLKNYMYSEGAFLIDEVLEASRDEGMLLCKVDTNRKLLVSPFQKGDPKIHPRHVSGADMIMFTANLGCLHAYFFHGCDWDKNWVGFGNRIKTASFKNLAELGPPLFLKSKETKVRKGPKRVVIEYQFEFTQNDKIVYESVQTAMFVKQV